MQTAASARSWFDHMPPAVTHEVNAFIKESNVIIEAVLPEDIKEAYRAFAEADPAFPESFGGRMQAIRLVPSEWLTGNIEFFLFKHTVVMNNWNEQTIMVVEDENIAAFLKSLYSFMHEAGKPFDQNAFVRSLPATH